MKKIALIFLMIFSNFISSAQQSENKEDFTEKILNFVISNMDDESVELENLYDGTTERIFDDNNEKLVLVEKLKKRGFKQVNFERGNFPPLGARIVNITLKKDDCECEVSKIYYFTTSDNVFITKEKIRCKKASQ
jgi:hypothetical protein